MPDTPRVFEEVNADDLPDTDEFDPCEDSDA